MKYNCYSEDGEAFRDGDLADAIQDYDLEAGQVVYLGVKDNIEPGELINECDIIEIMGDRAYDQVGEVADGYPDVTVKARAEMREFIEQWIAKHCPVRFWRVLGVVKHTVTAEDIAAAGE